MTEPQSPSIEKPKPTFLGRAKGSWFCVAFVFYKDGTKDVFSGTYTVVNTHLEKSKQKAFAKILHYQGNKVQSVMYNLYNPMIKRFSANSVYIFNRAKHGGIIVSHYMNLVYIRRVPDKWIPAFDGDFTGMKTFYYDDPQFKILRDRH
jgi:hypothetical protein